MASRTSKGSIKKTPSKSAVTKKTSKSATTKAPPQTPVVRAGVNQKAAKAGAASAKKATEKVSEKAPVKASAVQKAAVKKTALKPTTVKPSITKRTTTSTVKAVQRGESPKKSAGDAPSSDVAVLTVGDAVPAFEALNQDGELVKSTTLAGAPYVLYFYPKDDTPGCTTEACGFRDELAVFADRGVTVLGVSPDSPASHARFRQKYGLEFTLLSDLEKKLVERFGVWKLKQNYGREYWGVERSTFLIDAQGKIAKVWRGVKVAGHVPAVLEAVAQL